MCGLGTGAEDRVELGVVVGREPDVVVGESRRSTPQGQQQHESAERRRGAGQFPQRPVGRRVIDESAVDGAGVGVGHHDVGRKVLTGGESHAGDATRNSGDAFDLGVESQVHMSLGQPIGQRDSEVGESTAEVPGAKGLFDVGHGHQGGGGPAGIGAGVGGVPVEQGDHPRVAQPTPAEATKRSPGRDLPEVGRASQERQQIAWTSQRCFEDRSPGEAPHLAAVSHQPLPILGCRATQGVAQSGCHGAGTRAGQNRPSAVCPGIAEGGLDGLQINALLQLGPTGLDEEVSIDRGQGEQTGSGVEDEAVS